MTARTSKARSANTLQAYDSDWAVFTRWCANTGRTGRSALPASPQTLAEYLAEAADARPAGRGLGVHGLDPVPLGRRGQLRPPPRRPPLPRRSRARPGLPRRATPDPGIATTAVQGAVADRPDRRPGPDRDPGLAGCGHRRRDAALLLVAWASATRRSEGAALDRSDVTAHPVDGLHLQIQVSKTDPSATGQVVAIPFGSQPAPAPPAGSPPGSPS